MAGYFRPLRRKLGFATLVLACALMGGWLRSNSFADVIYFRDSRFIHAIVSMNNGLGWSRAVNQNPNNTGFSFSTGPLRSSSPQYPFNEPYPDHQMTKVERFGFLTVEAKGTTAATSSSGFHCWFVWYAVLACPLSVLSTCLLLSPSGGPKAPSILISEPAAAE